MADPAKQGPPPGYTPQPGYPPAQQGYPQAQPGYPPPQQGYPAPGYQPAGVHPPPQGYAPGPAPVPHTTVTVVNAGPACLRDVPCTMQCQYCQAHMTTYLTMDACSGLAWLICVVLLLVGLGLCSWIPFLIPACQDVEHHCGNCNRMVGKYRRL